MTVQNRDVDVGIHEYNGRYYLASWSDKNGQFSGPAIAELRKMCGWSGFFCRHERGLPGAGGYSYTTLAAARRARRKMLGYE